jgi:hypothetical protein
MNADAVVQTIQSVIAPTVMISGCTLIQNAILARYSGVGDRLRALVRERIDLLEKYDISEAIYADVLQVIDQQLIVLSRRYRLLQNTALLLYGAIACFLLAMFAIALAREFQTTSVSYAAFLLFLIGTAILLVGVFFAASEVRISHKAVRSEVRWAMALTDQHPSPSRIPA